ncbi:hypothetical protein [Gehongia tenuis]|uniref:DUF2229 domain-containing protein n=1 Tax=Gehongia tenuis TaxID=2763655 RepID=A0A926HPK2_9FIRM|nr:hypothetical protein [Gehongia tenuis]MBC8530271.1 hypothetical protein [Gehongia tenuis]
MKISFPYMGCVTGYQKMLELMGHEIIMPPRPTSRTVDLGAKYAPEFLCFPFKMMLGTYIEVAEQGAELIVSTGGRGPCRAGMYGEIHQRILRQLGYRTEIAIFDDPTQNRKAFLEQVKGLINHTSLPKALRSAYLSYRLIESMDSLEAKLKTLRPYEVEAGSFDRAWRTITGWHEGCFSQKDLKKVRRDSEELLVSIQIRNVPEAEKLRVGIVGEIYVAMESAANMDIERKLNSLGIETYNCQSLSHWLHHHIYPKWSKANEAIQIMKKARRYTPLNAGGHDMENIGWMMEYKERRMDGVVHLMPFGCLPELITQSLIPDITRDLDLPILSMSIDEQTGSVNNQTRLEAFADLIAQKKRVKNASVKAPSFQVPAGEGKDTFTAYRQSGSEVRI